MKRRALLLVLAVLTALAATQAPARAHGDDGAIEVVRAEPVGSSTVAFEIALTFTNDGDPADGATATVVAEHAASGTSVGPVPLEPTGEPGRYAAAVTLTEPGEWQVRFSSLSPVATLVVPHTVAAAPEPPTTTAPPTTVAPTTTAPDTMPTTDDGEQPENGEVTTARDAADDDDDGSSAGVVIGVVVIVIAVIGGVAYALRRRASASRS